MNYKLYSSKLLGEKKTYRAKKVKRIISLITRYGKPVGEESDFYEVICDPEGTKLYYRPEYFHENFTYIGELLQKVGDE